MASSGGAFQRVLHEGRPQPSRWSRKRAGSTAGQTPGARGSPLPTPSPQAAASPGHGCWQHPLPPSQKVSVLSRAGWGAVQNRERAQSDLHYLIQKVSIIQQER